MGSRGFIGVSERTDKPDTKNRNNNAVLVYIPGDPYTRGMFYALAEIAGRLRRNSVSGHDFPSVRNFGVRSHDTLILPAHYIAFSLLLEGLAQ
jgi:hypothetical protein